MFVSMPLRATGKPRGSYRTVSVWFRSTIIMFLLKRQQSQQHPIDDQASWTTTDMGHARVSDDWQDENHVEHRGSNGASSLRASAGSVRWPPTPPGNEQAYRRAGRKGNCSVNDDVTCGAADCVGPARPDAFKGVTREADAPYSGAAARVVNWHVCFDRVARRPSLGPSASAMPMLRAAIPVAGAVREARGGDSPANKDGVA